MQVRVQVKQVVVGIEWQRRMKGTLVACAPWVAAVDIVSPRIVGPEANEADEAKAAWALRGMRCINALVEQVHDTISNAYHCVLKA